MELRTLPVVTQTPLDGTLADYFTWTYNNRTQLRRLPRKTHLTTVEQTMLIVYYQVLERNETLRLGLEDLFKDWSLSRAKAFGEHWSLGTFALRNLEWSRDRWLRAGMGVARLHVGLRAIPGFEEDSSEEERQLLGYVLLPPRLRNDSDLARCATRLYMRAVEKASFMAIAKAEDPEATETGAVRETIEYWACQLGVELPHTKPGRPIGSRSVRPRISPTKS